MEVWNKLRRKKVLRYRPPSSIDSFTLKTFLLSYKTVHLKARRYLCSVSIGQLISKPVADKAFHMYTLYHFYVSWSRSSCSKGRLSTVDLLFKMSFSQKKMKKWHKTLELSRLLQRGQLDRSFLFSGFSLVMGLWGHTHKTSFSLYATSGPNTQGWKGLAGSNTLDYW